MAESLVIERIKARGLEVGGSMIRSEAGQSSVEYALIACVLAIGFIVSSVLIQAALSPLFIQIPLSVGTTVRITNRDGSITIYTPIPIPSGSRPTATPTPQNTPKPKK